MTTLRPPGQRSFVLVPGDVTGIRGRTRTRAIETWRRMARFGLAPGHRGLLEPYTRR
jgi:hypothetical protein